jgi:large subunit ribosomal protein L27
MSLAQLHRPLVVVSSSVSSAAKTAAALRQLQDGLAALRIGNANQAVEGRRYASVKSQGAYRIRDSSTIPKNLGAKKTGGMYHQTPGALFPTMAAVEDADVS